jgi:hypothetical protein
MVLVKIGDTVKLKGAEELQKLYDDKENIFGEGDMGPDSDIADYAELEAEVIDVDADDNSANLKLSYPDDKDKDGDEYWFPVKSITKDDGNGNFVDVEGIEEDDESDKDDENSENNEE